MSAANLVPGPAKLRLELRSTTGKVALPTEIPIKIGGGGEEEDDDEDEKDE